MKSLVVAVLLLSVVGPACQRSPAFKRDQDYYREPVSYYANKNGKTPTQRIESLGQPKKRVTVLNFWNDTPIKYPNEDIGAFAADELKRNLFSTQRLIVPTDAKSESGTADFIHGDRIKVAQLIREGRRMGVAVLIIGRITKAVFRQRGDEVGLLRQKQSMAGADVEIKAFDVAAGREIMAAAKSGEASANAMVAFEVNDVESREYRSELTRLAIRNAVGMLVPEIVRGIEKMTWEGRIAKIAGNKVYLNAGKTSGLVSGDILKVVTQGDDVYDPTTGAFLGRSPGQMKGTLEVVDFIGTDAAAAIIHTGGNFLEGDVVQLY